MLFYIELFKNKVCFTQLIEIVKKKKKVIAALVWALGGYTLNNHHLIKAIIKILNTWIMDENNIKCKMLTYFCNVDLVDNDAIQIVFISVFY